MGGSAIVLGLIFYSLRRQAEWREFRWDRLWAPLIDAHSGYLLAALGVVYVTYLLRAFRWRFFLSPVKKASLWTLFVGQILGFSAVYLIGRTGEFVRPAYIAKKEDVSLTSMAAVWVLERVYDITFVILWSSVALYLGPLEPTTRRAKTVLAWMHLVGLAVLLATALVIVFLVFFRLHAEELTTRVPRVFRFLPDRAQQHFEHFLRAFAAGLEVIRRWPEFVASVLLTLVLWIANTSVFWLVFKSVGGELRRLGWLAAMLVLFFAILGMIAQLPGIGGGFQVAAIWGLTAFFRIPLEEATGGMILLWLVLTVPCIALGLVFLVHEGLTFKKLEVIAEKERAVVEREL